MCPPGKRVLREPLPQERSDRHDLLNAHFVLHRIREPLDTVARRRELVARRLATGMTE